MASKRMIASDIWRDEFIGTLDHLGRLLWVGMIVTSADDQGRMQNNARLLRSDVFPLDDVPTGDIERLIGELASAGKIVTYTAGGKNLIQIVKWWEYQTPAWASPSKFDPPPGWIDREKYHTTGNKINVKNWDNPGGFSSKPVDLPSALHSPLPSMLPSIIEEGDGNGEGNGDGNGKGEGETSSSAKGAPKTPPPPATNPTNQENHPAVRMIYDVLGFRAWEQDWERVIKEFGDNPTTEDEERLREGKRIWAAHLQETGKKLAVNYLPGILERIPMRKADEPEDPIDALLREYKSKDDPFERARIRYGVAPEKKENPLDTVSGEYQGGQQGDLRKE